LACIFIVGPDIVNSLNLNAKITNVTVSCGGETTAIDGIDQRSTIGATKNLKPLEYATVWRFTPDKRPGPLPGARLGSNRARTSVEAVDQGDGDKEIAAAAVASTSMTSERETAYPCWRMATIPETNKGSTAKPNPTQPELAESTSRHFLWPRFENVCRMLLRSF
jgi:hypothetical protein